MDAIERERKFKVCNEAWRVEAASGARIWQGWLHADDRTSIRIRIADGVATVTCKVKIPGESERRVEIEGQVEMGVAVQLKELCGTSLEKTRWRVRRGESVWEIDEYHNELDGIVTAEIENPAEGLVLPMWIGEEVTGKIEWENAHMACQTAKDPRA
jgi:adenylate cyclase